MREVGSKSRGRGSAKLEFLGAVGTRQSWIVSVDNLVICKTVRPITTYNASLPTALPSSGARADNTHSIYRRADANPSPTGASPSGATGANPSLRATGANPRANGPTGPTKLVRRTRPQKAFQAKARKV